MSITLSTNAAGFLTNGLKSAIDAGAGAGYAKVYSGTRPSSGGTPTGSLLCTLPLAHPCGTINGAGSLALDAGADGQVLVTAAPTWARIFDGNDVRVMDCGVRLSSDPDTGQEIVIDAPALYAGAFVKIASGGFSVPT